MDLQERQLQGRRGGTRVFTGESRVINQDPRGLQSPLSHCSPSNEQHGLLCLVNGSTVASLWADLPTTYVTAGWPKGAAHRHSSSSMLQDRGALRVGNDWKCDAFKLHLQPFLH